MIAAVGWILSFEPPIARKISDIADKIFFHIPIKRVRENIRIDKTADATAEKVGEMLEHYYRGGMNIEKN